MRAADVYRALLWCYPAQFRHEYGGEMVGAFAEQIEDARRTAGRLAAVRVWITTLVDIAPTAFREHGHVIRQDLRYAVRILAGNPGFTGVAVLSLALGIGANTALFSLVNNVVMSTLPVRNPQELVMLTDPLTSGVSVGLESGDRSLATYQEFRDLQAHSTTLTALMASQSSLQRIEARVAGGQPEELRLRMVSASFFGTLGVPALIGRTFAAAQEPSAGTVPYAVISHEYWQRRFGGRQDVLGRPVVLASGTLSVIGVMPREFFGETIGERPDAWVPLAMQGMLLPGRDWLHDQPGNVEKVMWLHLFGRLPHGASLEQAQANANVIFQQGLSAYYGSMADAKTRKEFLDQRLRLRPAATGASSVRADFAEPLLVLLGAAGLVLLIACSNLGNLLLARTTARSREMAVRLALGASRGRLIRQLLTESLCLAAAGGAVGLGAAVLLRDGLLRLASDEAIALPAALDLRVLGFVFALTLVTGLILGLLPALRITRTRVSAGLREEGRTIAGSATWLRVGKGVVVGQLALSLPLLIGAGLLVRTLVNLQHVDLGYPKDDLLTIRVDGQSAGYDVARQAAAFEGLLTEIRRMPGVRAATYSNNGLFQGSDNGDRVIVEGYTPKGDNDRGSRYDQIGPSYFSTLGVPIVLGREIAEDDRAGGRTVCVINETFARRFFAGRNPLGLHVTQEYADQRHSYEVVGVARDSRQNRLRGDIEHRFYTPATQPAASMSGVTFIIRPQSDGSSVLAGVRRAIQRAEPKMAIGRAATVVDAIESRLAQDRLLARLSIAFGAVAVLLAAMGLYGVLSYGVARRTNEIGIRKALGAQHGMLVAMILRETAWLLVIGLVGGIALSAAALRLITSRLYGLSPSDPLTVAGATVGLALIALLATWLPARRASLVDPLVALRYE
jgi:predicted permease